VQIPTNNLDFRKIFLKENFTDAMVVHTKRAPQELIHVARTSGFEGRGGKQEALSGE
jgi:hypothetical protein